MWKSYYINVILPSQAQPLNLKFSELMFYDVSLPGFKAIIYAVFSYRHSLHHSPSWAGACSMPHCTLSYRLTRARMCGCQSNHGMEGGNATGKSSSEMHEMLCHQTATEEFSLVIVNFGCPGLQFLLPIKTQHQVRTVCCLDWIMVAALDITFKSLMRKT